MNLVQTVLDAVLYPDVLVYWQKKSGKDADEYVVYTRGEDSGDAYADDVALTKGASVTVRYYYRSEKLDTNNERESVINRENAILNALVNAGFDVPEGPFDSGDIDDIGFYVTVFECEYWRVV